MTEKIFQSDPPVFNDELAVVLKSNKRGITRAVKRGQLPPPDGRIGNRPFWRLSTLEKGLRGTA